MTRIRRLAGVFVVLVGLAHSFGWAAGGASIDPAQLRRHLLDSVGTLPRNPGNGYKLDGSFTLKATGEELVYNARYLRSSDRWAADFTQENSSLNLRYFSSGKNAWIASPEITVAVTPRLLPYMVQFDFHQLYGDLLRILDAGTRDPLFSISTAGNEIYVRGKLQNGWGAVFALNAIEYFPRKVHVNTAGDVSAAWMIPFARPDGTCSPVNFPGRSTDFEIWLSDPVAANGYRYAQRMDFVEHGIVIGSFFLNESSPISESEELLQRPAAFPWLESVRFTPHENLSRPSLYMNDSELGALRERMQQAPWAEWNHEGRTIAAGSIAVLWTGRLFPHPMAPKFLAMTLAIGFLAFIFLLIRRYRQSPAHGFSWRLLIAGILIGCIVFIAGIASYWLHKPIDRSRMALHISIRHAVTDHPFYAARADALFIDFAHKAPAKSMEELGQSCQAYALAYDLIRKRLPAHRRRQLEKELFDYARPLFGATRGWVSNTAASSTIASGLGMVGLAIDHEPFIAAAREAMDRMLQSQLTGGLHLSGPGQGSIAMDAAANLFCALQHTGRANYYAHPAFQQYVKTTLQWLSPVGTAPLFGDTNLDHSRGLSMFFLKIAARMPEETGRQCVAAHQAYWNHGRFSAEGWIKWFFPLVEPTLAYFENPYALLQYTSSLPASALPGFSAAFEDGQSAVLRSGAGPDSMYLALNMLRPKSFGSHRDILAFDLYAYQSLLLHGPGFPGKTDAHHGDTTQTAASNSITMNKEGQSEAQGAGITSSILNQPLFDQIRAIADETYDYGQVQRDVVMVRPEINHPAYFVLLDDIFVTNPATTIQWRLHGRGKHAAGIDQGSRWTSTVFGPPRLRPKRVILEVSHPIGVAGKLSSAPGTLYSQFSFLNLESQSTAIEWTGSGRFCTILSPRKTENVPVKIEPLSKNSCRIGITDWISIGNLNVRVKTGPLTHISEYSLVRDRTQAFPALLMVSGVECRFGTHSLFSDKPLTTSLNGLHGSFLNARPNTQVEINSPEIQEGSRFLLDGRIIRAEKPGLLIFTLVEAGKHSLNRVSQSSQIP